MDRTQILEYMALSTYCLQRSGSIYRHNDHIGLGPTWPELRYHETVISTLFEPAMAHVGFCQDGPRVHRAHKKITDEIRPQNVLPRVKPVGLVSKDLQREDLYGEGATSQHQSSRIDGNII